MANEFGHVLTEGAIFIAKSGEEVRVDVEFTHDLIANKNRNDNFGFGFERAREIAGIGLHVVHDDGLAGGRRSTADTLIKRNTNMWRHGAFERTKHEDIAITFLFEHVESDPVVPREFFMEQANDAAHQLFGRTRRDGKRIKSRNQIRRFRLCGSHECSRTHGTEERNGGRTRE